MGRRRGYALVRLIPTTASPLPADIRFLAGFPPGSE
jgi:hypothetical protein